MMESGRRLTGHADKLCATLVKTCVVIATDKELWETVCLSAADCVYLAGCVQVRKGGGWGGCIPVVSVCVYVCMDMCTYVCWVN